MKNKQSSFLIESNTLFNPNQLFTLLYLDISMPKMKGYTWAPIAYEYVGGERDIMMNAFLPLSMLRGFVLEGGCTPVFGGGKSWQFPRSLRDLSV